MSATETIVEVRLPFGATRLEDMDPVALIEATHYARGRDSRGLIVNGSVVVLRIHRGDQVASMQWPATNFKQAMADLGAVADREPRDEDAPDLRT